MLATNLKPVTSLGIAVVSGSHHETGMGREKVTFQPDQKWGRKGEVWFAND